MISLLLYTLAVHRHSHIHKKIVEKDKTNPFAWFTLQQDPEQEENHCNDDIKHLLVTLKSFF